MIEFLSRHKKALLIIVPIITAGVIGSTLGIIFLLRPSFEWSFSTPEQQGMNSTLIDEMISYAAVNGELYSLLVIRNGYIVVEEYLNGHDVDMRKDIWSVTKVFSSTIAGIAADKGFIDVDDYVLDYFRDLNISNITPEKENMTIRHLLTMTTGLNSPLDPYDTDIENVLSRPMNAAPGEMSSYINGVPHILMHIIQRAIGSSVFDFAVQNLFNPLVFKNYYWPKDGYGVPQGGFGLELTARDMAKLGLLFLNNGQIQGRRILSSNWVQDSISANMDLASGADYGYYWWLENSYYFAYGNNDQAIYVSPNNNLVAVFQSNNIIDMSLELIVNYILPSIVQ